METTLEPAEVSIDFPRFGSYTYTKSEVLEFPWGLPGFAELRRFVLLQIVGQDGFLWLQSLDDVNVAMPLASPWSFFEDYDPKIPLYAQAALKLEKPEEFVILNVVVVPKDGGLMTMNLLAPVVINLVTCVGRQVMLEDPRYSIRTPMVAAVRVPEEPAPTNVAPASVEPG